jgi:hypothetical protein
LEFLINNERERKILGQNCYEYHLKVIKNSEDNKKSLRYQPVKGILPKTLRKLL